MIQNDLVTNFHYCDEPDCHRPNQRILDSMDDLQEHVNLNGEQHHFSNSKDLEKLCKNPESEISKFFNEHNLTTLEQTVKTQIRDLQKQFILELEAFERNMIRYINTFQVPQLQQIQELFNAFQSTNGSHDARTTINDRQQHLPALSQPQSLLIGLDNNFAVCKAEVNARLEDMKQQLNNVVHPRVYVDTSNGLRVSVMIIKDDTTATLIERIRKITGIEGPIRLQKGDNTQLNEDESLNKLEVLSLLTIVAA